MSETLLTKWEEAKLKLDELRETFKKICDDNSYRFKSDKIADIDACISSHTNWWFGAVHLIPEGYDISITGPHWARIESEQYREIAK